MAIVSGQSFMRGARGLVLGFAVLALSEAPAFAQRGPQSVAPMAEKLIDAVVNISTTQIAKGPEGVPLPKVPKGSPFEDFFEDFFNKKGGRIPPSERKVSSLGSGFVIDGTEGLVVGRLRAGLQRLPLRPLADRPDGDVLPALQVDVGELGLDAKDHAARRAGLALEAAVEDRIAQVGAAIRVDAVHEVEGHRRAAGRGRHRDAGRSG